MRLSDAAQRLQDAPRHGADVGAAVTADLGFVAHAAQGDADELASHGAGDRAAQGGLAHPRRPDKAQDHALARAADFIHRLFSDLIGAFQAQLAHGQVFQDALFDILQSEVILVEHLAGMRDIEVIVVPTDQGRAISQSR